MTAYLIRTSSTAEGFTVLSYAPDVETFVKGMPAWVPTEQGAYVRSSDITVVRKRSEKLASLAA